MGHAVSESSLKQTPLCAAHIKAAGRMVEFGGWSMPVQYSSILQEHAAVRTAAGLFDISHMGEFIVSGPKAQEWLNSCFTNDAAKLEIGQGQYSIMLNERGGVIDDLIFYRTAADRYLVIVNASMIDEDYKWLESRLPASGIKLENQSDATAALALQGPKSPEILAQFLKCAPADLPERNKIKLFKVASGEVTVGRTGYTGEDGFELFFSAKAAETVWNGLLQTGKSHGLIPCGLGSRDTLRLEACYPLNGNDLSPARTPLEAGLGFFVSLTKTADFPGKSILQKQKTQGVPEKLVAIKLTEKCAPPRPHYPIFAGAKKIGELSSGCLSPTLGYGIGLGYVPVAHAEPGSSLFVEIRGVKFPAVVVKKPFYKRPS